VWLTFVLVLGLAGCARFEPRPLSAERNAEQLEGRSLTNAFLRRYMERALEHPINPWPPAAWDLENLSLAAYYYHPSLEVARAQWAVSQAGQITAGERPNPALTVTPTYNVTTTTPTPWLPVGYLDIPIETAGKRKHRQTRAAHLSEASRLSIFSVAWQVRRGLRAALLDFTIAERRAALLDSQQRLQEQVLAAAEAQMQAGNIAAVEVVPYRLAAAKIQVDLVAARRSAMEARARLGEAIGVPVQALAGVRLEFDWSQAAQSAEALKSTELRRAALQGRPDILSLLAEYAAAESSLRLEIAKQYPDVRLQPGYEYDQGDSKWSLGFTVDLPILNQNQGPIAEAEARRKEVAARFNALQAQVLAEIDRSGALVSSDLRSAALLDSVARTQQERQKSISAQFEAGAVDRLELLNAELESAAAQLAQLDGRTRLQQSIGALEDALQRPLTVPTSVLEQTAPNAP